MNVEEAATWYRKGAFTAADVTRATGLSERSQRELLKIGVLKAVPQAKTKARLLTSGMVKRAAAVAALSRCGLSLKVSGQIIYAAVGVEDLLFHVIDPIDALFDWGRACDPVTNLPPKR